MDVTVKRHILKAISWRTIGTLDTLVFALIFTGNIGTSLSISGYTIITKLIWYYIHERIWFKSTIRNTNSRHLLKTVTWRAVGTLDTILISYLLTGDGALGLQIGVFETISKMILYYLHERAWYFSNWGVIKTSKD